MIKAPRFLRFGIEALGVNFTKRSQSLGMTPLKDVIELLKRLAPHNYGYQDIRIGAEADGGYVVPDDFNGVTECFSPGCAGYWHFEKFLEDKFGIHSHICDSENFRPKDLGEKQDFLPFFVGPSTGDNFITLDDWMKRVQISDDSECILQIDIESAEYLTLLAASPELLKRFRMIVIELHHLEVLKNRHAFEMLYKPFFDKILRDFDVTHAHANNCCGNWHYVDVSFPVILELTLHRKDRRISKGVPKLGSSPLDTPNVDGRDELQINWEKILQK